MPGSAHSVGVGGWVVRADGAVLLVRMTYGPAKGRLMIPGGHLEADELLEVGAAREVREETGVEVEPLGLLMVRQRLESPLGNLYLVFLMAPLDDSSARADGGEVSEALWLPPAEIVVREDVQPIAGELATAWLAAPEACLARRELTWQDPKSYRVWAGRPTRPPRGGLP